MRAFPGAMPFTSPDELTTAAVGVSVLQKMSSLALFAIRHRTSSPLTYALLGHSSLALAGHFFLRCCSSRFEQHPIECSPEHAADDRCNPEQPELRQRPSSDKHGRPCTSRWIHRKIGHRYPDQMNERETEAN